MNRLPVTWRHHLPFRFCDLSTGTLRATLDRELLRVSELSFTFGLSPSLLTVAAETHYWLTHQDIFVWDFSTQAPAILLEGHDDSVVALVFSPDHTLLASQSVDQTVRIWDVQTHQTRAILNYNEGSSPYSIDALDGGNSQSWQHVFVGAMLASPWAGQALPLRLCHVWLRSP